jgi:dihydroorotase-like cyclic amidohydrolase
MSNSTLIHNARVFDGERLISENGYIVLQDGLIKDIGATDPSPLPSADVIINASGCTILPGLIDAHVHSQGGASDLRQALDFGVTTVLDMFNDPGYISEIKKESLKQTNMADIKSSCHAATVNGGWPEPLILMSLEKEQVRPKPI